VPCDQPWCVVGKVSCCLLRNALILLKVFSILGSSGNSKLVDVRTLHTQLELRTNHFRFDKHQ